MALNVHAQGNTEIVTGNVIGKILAFTVVNVSVLAFCGLLNLLFYPEVFNAGYYLFYWLTLNLPALVFFRGFLYCSFFLRDEVGGEPRLRHDPPCGYPRSVNSPGICLVKRII